MKKTIELRFRVTVEEGSAEERLLEFLRDKGTTRYSFREKVMLALSHWQPLADYCRGLSHERVLRSMQDTSYRMQLHQQYLQEKTGVELGGRSQLLVQPSVSGNGTKSEAAVTQRVDEEASAEDLEVSPEITEPANPFAGSVIVRS